MTTTTLASELEAINTLLQAAEEAPVASLALSGLYPLELAKGILSETSRVVQSSGWKWNTERDYPLSRDGSDQITLPSNVLSADVDDTDPGVEPVARGLKLYDARGHTYSFTKDLTATVVLLLPWDELPQPFRHYITIRAARTMQGRTSVSDATYKYTMEDEQDARLAAESLESNVGDHNMLRDSWSVASVLNGRELM